MALDLELEESVVEPVVSEPVLLMELEPRRTAFLRNLRDLFWTPALPPLRSAFLSRRTLAGCICAHQNALAGIFQFAGRSRFVVIAFCSAWPEFFLARRAIVDHPDRFRMTRWFTTLRRNIWRSSDTGSAPAEKTEKGDPEFAPQPIISVPPQADNHVQTIVTPPKVKLDRDVPLPNIVAWTQTPQAVPLAATTRNAADRGPRRWRLP